MLGNYYYGYYHDYVKDKHRMGWERTTKPCPKLLKCKKHIFGLQKGVHDGCQDIPGYADICMNTCNLCKPGRLSNIGYVCGSFALLLGVCILGFFLVGRFLRCRHRRRGRLASPSALGAAEANQDGTEALVPQTHLQAFDIDLGSQDEVPALIDRRARMNERIARDNFSSTSLVETFSMLTEDIFKQTRLFGIEKLGVYEHWIIRAEHVQLSRDAIQVGRGSFGEVRRGWLYEGTAVAIKEAMCMNRDQGLFTLANEMRLLRRIRHPNIVLFHGVLVNRENLSLSLVLEWVDGQNLEAYIQKSREHISIHSDAEVQLFLSQTDLKLIIDVVRGMQYLHGQVPVILHRDLKPSNVLIETSIAPPRAKIADFGLSAMERSDGHTQRVGTPAYMAPEIQRSERYSTSADVYSFGRLLLFALTARHPSSTSAMLPIVSAWVENDEQHSDSAVDSKFFATITFECLQSVPQSRPPFSRILRCLSSLSNANSKDVSKDSSSSTGRYVPPAFGSRSFDQEADVLDTTSC